MSKNSNKQLYMQLREWMPNAFKQRGKHVKRNVRQPQTRLEQYGRQR